MVTRVFLGLAAAALLAAGCELEEPPRYPHQCYQAACVNQSPVVVNVRTPPPAPARALRARCRAGTYWHPGRARWNGRRWVAGRGRCVRAPVAYRHRRGCVFLRGRWVRTRRGWRAVRGRWVCRR